MPKSRAPYPTEFPQRIIELVGKDRALEALAEQFEPSARTIRNWLDHAARDTGQRADGCKKTPRGLVCQGNRLDPVQGFELVTAHRGTHRLAMLCRVLGVSPSGYYTWRSQPLSARPEADVTLGAQIQALDGRSHGTYRVPRVHAELPDARRRRAARQRAEGSPNDAPGSNRDFMPAGPDRLWLAPITYIPTPALHGHRQLTVRDSGPCTDMRRHHPHTTPQSASEHVIALLEDTGTIDHPSHRR